MISSILLWNCKRDDLMKMVWGALQKFVVSSVLAIILFVYCGSPASAASCLPRLAAEPTDIVKFQGQPLRQLGNQLFYITDRSETLELPAVLKRFATGRLDRMSGKEHFSGEYDSTIHWIGFALKNETDAAASLLLTTNVPWLRVIEFYLLREDCQVELLLNRKETSPYRSEDFFGEDMTGRQFQLAAGQTATLIVRYGSYGLSLLPLSIETSATLTEVATQKSVKRSIYYTFTLAMLVFFVGFNLALAGSKTVMLTASFATGVFLLAQLDGLLFPMLWPNSPLWNRDASFYILTLMSVFSFVTIANLTASSGWKRLSWVIYGVAAIVVIPVLLVPFVDIPTLTLGALAGGSLAIASMAFTTVMWARGAGIKRIIAIVAGVLAGFIMFAMVWAMIVGSGGLNLVGHDLAKAVYFLVSISLMIAFTTRARGVSSDLRVALQQQLASARRDVETSKALLEAEREFVGARELAEQRRAQLAEASHDLRQPIAALRLYIDRLPQNSGDVSKPSLERALEFVENILVQNLEKTDHSNGEDLALPDNTYTSETAIADDDTKLESFPAQLILDTCHAMFFDQAKHKNLELRVIESSLQLRSAATPVLRIVCNLVSNSVKFTHQGKVVIGVVRRGERVEFVIADTGPGIEASEQDRIFQPYEKTIDSDGHGLGLAIAKQLCDANNLDMKMTTKPGAGTCFRVSVPRLLSSTIDDQKEH